MTALRSHSRLAIFAVLVLLQALVVVGFVVREERIRATGRQIVLKAAPVDPRDLLRGDYVILGYEIQQLPSYGPDVVEGDTVIVRLRREGDYYVIDVAGRYPPYWSARTEQDVRPGDVVLRGTVVDAGTGGAGARVAYPNLDRFYVPAGTGNLPKPPDAVVVVDREGNARIIELRIDGKPWPPPPE